MQSAAPLRTRGARLAVLAGCLCAAALAPAWGAVVAVGSRAALSGASTVDWGALGPDQTPLAGTFALGTLTVTGASAFSVFTGATYSSDFNAADSVLALFDLPNLQPLSGVFSISFATAVAASGAQVQGGSFGSFSGTLSAFNAGNTLLGSAAFSGVNAGNADDSAVFIGLLSNAADIKRIEFSVSGSGAAINQLSVVSAVPEPAHWHLLGLGVAGMAAMRKRSLL